MIRFSRLVLPVLFIMSLALMRFTIAQEQPATAPGTVSVTVVDKGGQPVAGVTVRVTLPRQASPRVQQQEEPNQPAQQRQRPTPVAEGKTDNSGKVTLQNVPAGDYNLAANLRGAGSARQKISVKSGETLNVELKLLPRTPTTSR